MVLLCNDPFSPRVEAAYRASNARVCTTNLSLDIMQDTLEHHPILPTTARLQQPSHPQRPPLLALPPGGVYHPPSHDAGLGGNDDFGLMSSLSTGPTRTDFEPPWILPCAPPPAPQGQSHSPLATGTRAGRSHTVAGCHDSAYHSTAGLSPAPGLSQLPESASLGRRLSASQQYPRASWESRSAHSENLHVQGGRRRPTLPQAPPVPCSDCGGVFKNRSEKQ